MLGKLSIIGAVVAVSPQRCPPKWVAPLIPASTLGVLLTPALPFAAPSSEVSLARIWGLGARRASKFTVVASIVRPPQSSADDGADSHGQTSLLVRHRSSAKTRWIETHRVSALDCLARRWCSDCGADNCRNISSIG